MKSYQRCFRLYTLPQLPVTSSLQTNKLFFHLVFIYQDAKSKVLHSLVTWGETHTVVRSRCISPDIMQVLVSLVCLPAQDAVHSCPSSAQTSWSSWCWAIHVSTHYVVFLVFHAFVMLQFVVCFYRAEEVSCVTLQCRSIVVFAYGLSLVNVTWPKQI